MIINENLVDLSKMTYTGVDYDKDTKIAKVVNEYHASRLQIALPEGYKVGDTYTFSCNIDNIDGNNLLNVRAYPGKSEIKELKSDGSRQSFTFKLNDKNTHIYLYLGINSHTKGSYKIYNIKLDEGAESTTYVPSKNSLDSSKQAIFKAGGSIPRGVSTLRLGVGYVS